MQKPGHWWHVWYICVFGICLLLWISIYGHSKSSDAYSFRWRCIWLHLICPMKWRRTMLIWKRPMIIPGLWTVLIEQWMHLCTAYIPSYLWQIPIWIQAFNVDISICSRHYGISWNMEDIHLLLERKQVVQWMGLMQHVICIHCCKCYSVFKTIPFVVSFLHFLYFCTSSWDVCIWFGEWWDPIYLLCLYMLCCKCTIDI